MKKYIFISFGIIIFCILLGLSLDLLGLNWYKFIMPQKEDARREVFTHTRSYIEGKTQDLIKYKHEYDLASSVEDKKAIESAIRLSFAEFDENQLNSNELKDFLKKIKYGRVE